MEALKLSGLEVDFYFNAFDSCNVEKSGKLSSDRVRMFLSRFGISDSLIDEIMQLSNSSASSLWGRANFFTALKFVSLAQSGIPLSKNELLKHRGNLPLPIIRDVCEPPLKSNISREDCSAVNSVSIMDCFNPSKQSDQHISHMDEFNDKQIAVNNIVESDVDQSFGFTWPKCYDEEQSLLAEESTIHNDNLVSFDDKKVFRDSDWCISNISLENGADLNTDYSKSLRSDTITSQDFISSTHIARTTEESNNSRELHGDGVWSYRDLPDYTSDLPSQSQSASQYIDSRYTNPEEDKYQFSTNNAYYGVVNKQKFSHSRSSSFPLSQYNNPYCSRNDKRKERHLKWLASFALQSKREAEYTAQFDELFISQDIPNLPATDRNLKVTHSEVTQLFTAQYTISSTDFDRIWLIADIDRDNFLDKHEFCLASHLAHLFGHRGLSLDDAVVACKPYISKIIRKLKISGRQGVQFDSEHLCTTGLLNSHSKYNSMNNPLLKQYSALDILNHENPTISEYPDCDISEIGSMSSCYNSFEDLSHDPNESCDSYSKSSSSAGTVGSESISSFVSSSSPSTSCLSATSSPDNDSVDSVHLSSEKANTNNSYTDPIRLLSTITGRRKTFLSELSSRHRRRLLSSIIHEAKSVNHMLLRLNNEMQGELAELNDQQVNLSAQLQHLGIQSTL
ncbi:RalBP1-associated Eps domain-containing protein isoform 2 [Schistosoma japonicum]|uniref:RalBP1-associated Eps domain-containing protein isoform 2 n=1 Tax=Schistosoma japonicum TaxID=6182 RepID=A0A4Z2CYY7_SCHJA|nr:RalBP1-associated Eps domain-containing protein isoform 2 [Schistosoma japonicum]